MEKKITQILLLVLTLSSISIFVLYVTVRMEPPQTSQQIETSLLTSSAVPGKEDLLATKNTPVPITTGSVVDRATFEEVLSPIFPNNHEYFRDKNFVYRNEFGQLRIFVGAVPKGFELVDICGRGDGGGVLYVKDSLHVFCNEKIIPGADPVTFMVLGEIESTSTEDMPYVTSVAKDKNHVYFGGEMMNGIDPNMCTKDTFAVCLAR